MNHRPLKWVYVVAAALGLPAIWILIATTGENVPAMLAFIVALIGWAVIGDLIADRIWGNRVAVFLLSIVMSAFLLWWAAISRPVAELALSPTRSCKMQFHQWWTGKCVLSCEEDGVRIGTAALGTGPFTHPWAAFPGPDGNTVVCFSWLDTTYAAFTVDLTKRNPDGVTIPRKLGGVVHFSNFEIRACNPEEVTFVANLIRSDQAHVSGFSRWGLTSPESKEGALRFLKLATTRYEARDPVLKEARPHFLPGDE